MWNLIVSVPDHCLFIYFGLKPFQFRLYICHTGTYTITTYHKRFYTWYEQTESSSLLYQCRPDSIFLCFLQEHILLVHLMHGTIQSTLYIWLPWKRHGAVFLMGLKHAGPSAHVWHYAYPVTSITINLQTCNNNINSILIKIKLQLHYHKH